MAQQPFHAQDEIDANCEWITRFDQKLQATLARIRGEEKLTKKETWRMIQPIIHELMTAKTCLHEICIPTWSS